jgi:signal transduction histidine kinase
VSTLRAALLLFALLLVGLLAAPAAAHASPTPVDAIDVTAPGRVDLRARARLRVDPTGALSALDVLRDEAALIPATSHPIHQGFTDAAYWLDVTLLATTEAASLRYLQVFPSIDHAEVHVVNASRGAAHQRAGRREPLSARAVPDPSLVFPVHLAPGEPTRVLVRLTGHDVVRLDLDAVDPATLMTDLATRRLAWGLSYGVLGALILYNLVLLVLRRDRAYVYYVLFQGSLGLFNASLDQLTLRYLWPDSPDWSSDFETVAIMLTVFGACGFVRWFLSTPGQPVPGGRLLRALQGGALVLVFGARWTDWRPFAVASMAFVFIATCAVFATCARAVRLRTPGARFALPAWGLLMASAAVIIASTLSQWDVRGPMEHLLRVSTVSEAALLSAGLVVRVTALRAQNERMSKEMLRQRVASLDHLVAGVVHEIANPLHCVRSGAEVVAKRLGAAAESGALAEALDIVDNGTRRIDAILTTLRQQTSRAHEEVVEGARLADVVRETLAVMRGRLEGQGVRVTTALEGLPRVKANGPELGQVFANLVLNACQAMPRGGELVLRGSTDGERVCVTVSDTGPGIAAEHRSAIFDPFFTTRGPSEGTGLGLYVCLQLIANRGGTLRLEPSDVGASFAIELPVADG